MASAAEAQLAEVQAYASLFKAERDEARARVAQLEDELIISRQETAAAFAGQKPPVTIISDSPTTTVQTDGGDVSGLSVPAPVTETSAVATAEAQATGYTLAAVVAGALGMVWLVFRIFGRKR